MNNFDLFAKNYREIHNGNLKNTGYDSFYFAERKVREIIRHVKRKGFGKRINILDLGCGDGLSTFYLKKYFPEAFVYGLDISRESIKAALKKNIPDSDFRFYDGEKMPYSDKTFDIILLAGVLHHITKNESRMCILRECNRVLTPEGRLFVFEHNPFNPITTKIVDWCIFDKGASLISIFGMNNLLRKSNFQSKKKFIIFLPGFMRNLDFIEKLLYFIPMGGQYYYVCRK